MRTKIFIDFDGTLFDTERMKNDLNQPLIDAGMSPELVQEEYEIWKKAKGHPDPEAMLESLIIKYPDFNFNGAMKKTREVVEGAKKYLFEDVTSFLEKIDRKRFEPILFTLGFEHWQSQKIEKCNISHYFADVLYPIGDKVDSLRELVGIGERFIVLDDSQEFIDAVTAEFSERAEIVQMNRYPVPKEDQEGSEEETKPLKEIKQITSLSEFKDFSLPEHTDYSMAIQ